MNLYELDTYLNEIRNDKELFAFYSKLRVELCEKIVNNINNDLFEYWDILPNDIQAILLELEDNPTAVHETKEKLNKLGYDFEIGADFQPHELKKISVETPVNKGK